MDVISAIWEWLKGLLTEPPSSFLQLLILYTGAGIAIVGGILKVRRIIWPSRPKATWYAGAIPTPQDSDIYGQADSDVNSAWRKDRLRWSQGRRMKAGDWYELHFEKPRALSEIVVRSQGPRFPKKFKLSTKKPNNKWEIEADNQQINLNQEDQPISFKHRFGRGNKIEAIRLDVIEPTLDSWDEGGRSPAWSIYNIDLKEYKIFSRLCEGKIG